MAVQPIFTLEQLVIGWTVCLILARVITEIIVRLDNKNTAKELEKQDHNNSQFNHNNKEKWSNNG